MPGCDSVVDGSARGAAALANDLYELGGLGPRAAAPAGRAYRTNDLTAAADVRVYVLARAGQTVPYIPVQRVRV